MVWYNEESLVTAGWWEERWLLLHVSLCVCVVYVPVLCCYCNAALSTV